MIRTTNLDGGPVALPGAGGVELRGRSRTGDAVTNWTDVGWDKLLRAHESGVVFELQHAT